MNQPVTLSDGRPSGDWERSSIYPFIDGRVAELRGLANNNRAVTRRSGTLLIVLSFNDYKSRIADTPSCDFVSRPDVKERAQIAWELSDDLVLLRFLPAGSHSKHGIFLASLLFYWIMVILDVLEIQILFYVWLMRKQWRKKEVSDLVLFALIWKGKDENIWKLSYLLGK